MSGFFGIFNPKGTGIDLEAFEQMKKASGHTGHEGIETYVDDHVALGHVMLNVSPGSEYNQQPLRSTCGKYILVGHFRLDYRDELGDKLGLTNYELGETADSELVMLAYQKWKEKCVYHLEGDWSFVIFSFINKEIIFLKDPMGVSALFYSLTNSELFFASDITSLQGLKKHEIDLANLFCLSLNGFNSIHSRTLLKGIFFVESGTFHVYKNKIKKAIYFNFNSFSKTRNRIIYLKEDDYIFDFFSSFYNAVKTRIYSQDLGILLSGGLDSSAVAAIIEKELQLKKRRLKAFTSIPDVLDSRVPNAKTTLKEKEFVKEFCKLNSSVEPSFLSFPDFFYSKHFAKCMNSFNPILTNNTFWLEGIIEFAQKENVKYLFNGQLGNYSVSWTPSNFLLSYLFELRLRRLMLFIVDLVKNGYSIRDVFIKLLIIPFREFCRKTYGLIFYRRNISKKTIFNKKKLDSKFLSEFIKANKIILGYSNTINSNEIRREILNSLNQKIGMFWYLESDKYGIVSLDPTADLRFISKTFSFSTDIFFKNRQSKFLFKASFDGYLPEIHLRNNYVFKQSIDAAIRIRRDASLEKYIYSLKEDKILNEVFKIDKVIEQYESIVHSNDSRNLLLDCNLFLKNLSIISFYKNYS